jgi:UPF0716 family protein affecting phage T7 exclusion
LIKPGLITDLIGAVLLLIVVACQLLAARAKVPLAEPAETRPK